MSLEEIVKSLATNTQMFQQETRASIKNLKTQISQLATFVRNIETNRGKLPSQAEINPRENTSAMTLRSGREVQTMLPAATPESTANRLPVSTSNSAVVVLPAAMPKSTANRLPVSTPNSAAVVLPTTIPDSTGNIPPAVTPNSAAAVQTTQPAVTPESAAIKNNKLETEPAILDAPRIELSCKPIFPITKYLVPSPFLGKLVKARKEESEHDIFETFWKVEVNIPLLDAIKQILRYAKFLKELCTNKKKLNIDEKTRVGENVSTAIQRKLPQKCKDPGMFIIPCVIGNHKVERVMLDLGASINVMPLLIYKVLNLGPLKETRVIIQMADRSNSYPEGVVEDVLIRINELIFVMDFYIIDMDDEFHQTQLIYC